jgi:hypothetical protein
MIVWINGTFGAGKTTTAAALVELLPAARLFDTTRLLHHDAATMIAAACEPSSDPFDV